MIPGKIFFQSISISQQLSNKYQIYLLLNGIFYDKIKLFQTKYLCLTVNDIVEVQLCCQILRKDNKQNMQVNDSKNKNLKRKIQHLGQGQKLQNSSQKSLLKVNVPLAYKLMIQNKTIDIKYRLNSDNNFQQIKINLLFQTVASFNRKKLAATMSPSKNRQNNFNLTTNANGNNFHNFHNTSTFSQNNFDNNSQNNTPYDYFFPQNLDFSRKRNQKSPQNKVLTQEYEGEQMVSSLNNILPMENIQRQKKGLQKKTKDLLKFKHEQILIMRNEDFEEQTLQEGFESEKYPNNKIQSYQKNKELSQKFCNTTNNFDLFEESNRGQVILTSRTHQQLQPSYRKHNLMFKGDAILEINRKDERQYLENENHYRTQSDYKSQLPSELDTLESLAYQREKILGQLFGKFNKNSR